jgi:hypothetical protein
MVSQTKANKVTLTEVDAKLKTGSGRTKCQSKRAPLGGSGGGGAKYRKQWPHSSTANWLVCASYSLQLQPIRSGLAMLCVSAKVFWLDPAQFTGIHA